LGHQPPSDRDHLLLANGWIDYLDFADYCAAQHSFVALAADTWDAFNLGGRGAAEQVPGLYVSSAFFKVMGRSFLLGLPFGGAEDRPDAAPVFILFLKPQRVRSLIEISTARRALGRLKNDLYCTLQDLVVIKGSGDVLEVRILGSDRRSSGVPGAI